MKKWDYLIKSTNVRVSTRKAAFQKEYTGHFSDEIFQIKKIFPTNPKTFEIADANDEIIIGKFYNEEFSLADKNTTFRVKEILKTRTRKGKVENLVSWVGHPALYNSWISEQDFD